MCFFCVAAAAAVPGAPAPSAHPPVAPFFVASFVSPVLFSFMGLNVYSYGLMVAAALGIAFMVFGDELKRARIDLDEYNCFFVFLAGFAIGSKSHLALSAFGAGEELTWKAFDLRTGHSFIGSQLGAVGFMLVYIMRRKVGVLPFLDVLLPCCLIGHVIGKGGCFLSGDGCYGPPADPLKVPWAMSFPNAAVPTHVPVHPTPIYEALCSGFVVLLVRTLFPLPAAPLDDQPESKATIMGLTYPKAGRRTALLLVLFGIERTLIEQVRQHPPIQIFGGLTEYQAIAMALLVVGILIELFTSGAKKGASEGDKNVAGGKKKKKNA